MISGSSVLSIWSEVLFLTCHMTFSFYSNSFKGLILNATLIGSIFYNFINKKSIKFYFPQIFWMYFVLWTSCIFLNIWMCLLKKLKSLENKYLKKINSRWAPRLDRWTKRRSSLQMEFSRLNSILSSWGHWTLLYFIIILIF